MFQEGAPKALMIDLRRHKDFAMGHMAGAFCIAAVEEKGREVLKDSSERPTDWKPADKKREKLNRTRGKWGPRVWMGKVLVCYASGPVPATHKVVEHLQWDESTLPSAIFLLDAPFLEFENRYPGLCSSFAKPRAAHRYPAELIPGHLYLGDWKHAEDSSALDQLNVGSLVTIHQRPQDLVVDKWRRQLKITQDDTDTDAILEHFAAAFAFIDAAKHARRASLIHCGAGISRSATLAIAFLMRHHQWNLKQALEHTQLRRPPARPNEGFMKALQMYEAQLFPDKPPSMPKVSSALEDMLSGEGGGGSLGGGGGGGPRAVFEILKDGKPVGEFVMDQTKVYTVGRAPDVDLMLDHASISRRHAVLEMKADGDVTIMDPGSAHGIKLNGGKVPPKRVGTLMEGDKIVFGASSRTYRLHLNVPAGEGGGGGAAAARGRSRSPGR